MRWSGGARVLSGLAFYAVASSAGAASWPQALNIRFKDSVVALLRLDVVRSSTGLVVNSTSESMPGGKLMEKPVRATFTHELSSDWGWQKSSISNPRLSPFPFEVRIESGRLLYDLKTSTGVSRRYLPASGKVMPRTALLAYLVEAAPREAMKETELLVLDEDTMTLRKVVWTFLGTEGRGSNRAAKFEIKGDLKLVLRIDSKGRLRSIKDMDLGLFYEN